MKIMKIMKIFIINNLDDINSNIVTHFSLDKGLYLAYGLYNCNNDIYFLTSSSFSIENNIKFININEADSDFLNSCDLIIIIREAEIENILENYPSLKNIFFNNSARKVKIMIKSDSIQWILNKSFRKYLSKELHINASINSIRKWVNKNIDYICVQNKEFKNDAINNGILSTRIIESNMGVPKDILINFGNYDNPYNINHSYCKLDYKKLKNGDALYPKYYQENLNKLEEFNKKRYIIVYTGRIKTDNGKIIYLMKEIMDKLGEEYELHIFPGSFYLTIAGELIRCSARNINHLLMLRDTVFPDTKNVIIHYPFEHKHGQKYLYYADCGIDFSPSRPKDELSHAGNAKLLEYCSIGLPVVCETNINNSHLVRSASNGILIDGIGTSDQYIDAIKILLTMKINRRLSSEITVNNNNWDLRAVELITNLSKQDQK